ncbi:hypothetical protein [Aulosira sp. FACHB-615]|uniref:gp53-like domain-containing protein n=1 Tax=Aulosira sp. FACHB-615 TaxID=2692777 RepID=UPI00168A281A|nr:hypothetical protein [Aulosira sp. FACHB-615]MBD2491141.1 hypothetical protein [Aulosira sp. FACHB-615]
MPLTNPNTTALQKANNLNDLANAASAWLNLGADQSFSTNSGWFKLPNGLIYQWRAIDVASQSYAPATIYAASAIFSVAFNTIYSWVGSQTNGAIINGGYRVEATNTQTTVRYQFNNSVTTTANFKVFALGI